MRNKSKQVASLAIVALAASLSFSACTKATRDPLSEGFRAQGIGSIAEKPCGIKLSLEGFQSLARSVHVRLTEAEAIEKVKVYKEEARKNLNDKGRKAFCDEIWKEYGDDGARLFVKATPIEHF